VAVTGRRHRRDGQSRRHSSWRFEAGPFSILVKGTAFRLGFDAAKGRLDLHMKTGVVEVRGPRADRVLTLRAGESLELFANPPSEAPIAAPVRVTQERRRTRKFPRRCRLPRLLKPAGARPSTLLLAAQVGSPCTRGRLQAIRFPGQS